MLTSSATMLTPSGTMLNLPGAAPGIIPRLRKMFSDPEERFNLYDAPSRRDVERSAITAASIRDFPEAFNRNSFLIDVRDLPPGFGGRHGARSDISLTPALRRIVRPDQPAETVEAPVTAPSPFRTLVGLGPANARQTSPTPIRKDEDSDSFFDSSGGVASLIPAPRRDRSSGDPA